MLYMILLLIVSMSLYLYLRFSTRIPILMYHRIADVPGDRNALPVEKFIEQLAYLKQNGYHTATLEDVYLHYTKQKTLPPKSVLLTFDDGYKDNYTTALPLLKEYCMTAVVFPIANWIGRENQWENFHKAATTTMTLEELKLWHSHGMEIASHTVNHPFLSTCKGEQLQAELMDSKQQLSELLGISIDFLCYPYGNFNQATILAAKNAGYKAAFAIFDQVPLWNIDVYALPRIQISARQSINEFKLKVSKIHTIFIAMRQFERWFKKTTRK